MTVPIVSVAWEPCWRIIPSRFPPVDLFERIAPREDWATLMDLETRTNQRVRSEGPADAAVSSMITAPFMHPDPCGDSFSDGTLGIAYALPTFGSALARSVRRREEFLRHTRQGPIVLQMRVLNMDLRGMLHDLRGRAANDLADTVAMRELCRTLHEEGSVGLIYLDNFAGVGETVAAFRPKILSNCRQERHLAYRWNGERITEVYDYSADKLTAWPPPFERAA